MALQPIDPPATPAAMPEALARFAHQAVPSSGNPLRSITYAALAIDGLAVVGHTSASNADFVRSLGCYDSVVTYDDLDDPNR